MMRLHVDVVPPMVIDVLEVGPERAAINGEVPNVAVILHNARGEAAARWVGAAACIFMLSDALIAVNKFLTPVPLASFWILMTYYAAQLLIVHHVRGRKAT